MIIRADFNSLTDDLQDIFNEVSRVKIAEMVGNKIFNIFETNRRTYDHLVLHGLAGIQEVAEGQDLPRVTGVEGDTITWTQRYFGAIVPVTKTMRKFDLYNQIEKVTRSIAEDAWDKLDQSLADALLYGWATSYTDVYGKAVSSVGPDGVELISDSHTTPVSSANFSNLIQDSAGNDNPALSRDAIVNAIKQGRIYTDPNGLARPIRLDTLIVPPELEDLANRLIMSEKLPGTANNDINPLFGKIKIVVWERLQTRSDATDTSAYWFMVDSSKVAESLQVLFAERPSLDAPEQVYSNKNWDYSIDYYYAIGLGFQAYVFGADGTGS